MTVVPDSCAITKPADHSFIPPSPYRAQPAPGNFWFGTDKLWTELPVTGTWSGLPHYMATSNDQTYYRNKLLFWRQGYDPHSEPRPNLTITGRRIDGPAPPLQTDGKGNGSWTNDDQFIMTGITLPTPGCWEITGHYEKKELSESDQLTFIIWVAPASFVSTAFDRRQYMNAEDGVRFGRALEVPDPQYPEKARRRSIQGTIVLAIAINKDGEIDKVKVIQRLDPDLDLAAVNAVKQWRFAPAEKDGEAVPFQTLVKVSFRVH